MYFELSTPALLLCRCIGRVLVSILDALMWLSPSACEISPTYQSGHGTGFPNTVSGKRV